jgi:hypothetical protein
LSILSLSLVFKCCGSFTTCIAHVCMLQLEVRCTKCWNRKPRFLDAMDVNVKEAEKFYNSRSHQKDYTLLSFGLVGHTLCNPTTVNTKFANQIVCCFIYFSRFLFHLIMHLFSSLVSDTSGTND